MSIHDLIAAEKAKIEAAEPARFPVALGGTKVDLSVLRLEPHEWANLAAKHKPRAGTVDDGVGYNQETLPADYPVTHVTVDGETVDQDTWRELYKVLAPTHKATVGNIMWGENVWPGIKEMRELGKATAGKPSGSPARKGSPRAAGSGGSRPK